MHNCKTTGWFLPALILICLLGTTAVSGCRNPSTTPDLYMRTNQQWIEGISSKDLNILDIDAVFSAVYSQLPGEVTVYPSENYYYFIFYVNGREYWGNIRLPAGSRENGILSFAYFEFDEFNDSVNTPSYSKLFDNTDGVRIVEVDPFTWTVTYENKSVTFNLYQMGQEPPSLFTLGEDEVFVERTFDESGYQFFLIFKEKEYEISDGVMAEGYFFWVLNEEEEVPDVFDQVGDEEDLIVGRRSGFAFWIDPDRGNRKVLASIRSSSSQRNDYYDGPFDQLADNYVYLDDEDPEHVDIITYIVKALPGLEGKIDKYGYYTTGTMRVALSNYGMYLYQYYLPQFLETGKATSDIYHYFSSRGTFEQE